MDAESQQVEELKAEIERLKEAMEAVDDHGRALSFMETLKAKDAEIERLTRKLREEREAFLSRQLHDMEEREAFLSRQLHDTALITELCDAMKDWEAAKHWGWTQELLQRARKATPYGRA